MHSRFSRYRFENITQALRQLKLAARLVEQKLTQRLVFARQVLHQFFHKLLAFSC